MILTIKFDFNNVNEKKLFSELISVIRTHNEIKVKEN